MVDAAFSGSVGGMLLDEGYAGSVRIDRDLVVSGDVVIAGGEIQQSAYTLRTGGWLQSGGHFSGGRAPMTINGQASLCNGIFDAPASTLSVSRLDIQASAIV